MKNTDDRLNLIARNPYPCGHHPIAVDYDADQAVRTLQFCRTGKLCFIAIILLRKLSHPTWMRVNDGRNPSFPRGLSKEVHQAIGRPCDVNRRGVDHFAPGDRLEGMTDKPATSDSRPRILLNIGNTK